MAVAEQTPYKEYVANGVTNSFPLEFDCDDQDHLIVTVNDIEIENGYWLLINGAVVFGSAPANQAKIVIQRNTPFERNTNYQTFNNSFRPQPVNKDFDRIWLKLQELGHRDQLIWLALVKEIADRIAVDKNLQNQINAIDSWLEDLQQNVNENTSDIAQLVNDLSKEIADRITNDLILKDMFLTIIDTAINEGTVNALAITHVDNLDELNSISNLWEGRTVCVTGIGNYKYNSNTGSWERDFITDRQVVKINYIADLAITTPWEGRNVYIRDVGFYEYKHGMWKAIMPINTKISSCTALQEYSALYDGQIAEVKSFADGWAASAYGVPVGGGKFIYMPNLDASAYKADGGTIIVTDDDKVWVREELFTSKEPRVYAEWFGCDNSFYTDDAANIRKAIDACLFWRNTGTIDSKYAIGGMLGSKVTLVMPKQWYIKSTIYINMTYISIDLNDGIGLVSNNGIYDAHPLLANYKMALAFRGTVAAGIDFVPAYYSNRIMYNGTLVYGDVTSNGNIGRFPLNDSKIIAASYYGTTETIRSAVGTIDNVSYSCFGVGYSNGNYGWGYTHNDCKFDQCYEPFILTNGTDNGEKISHVNCMSFNCGTLGNINNFQGDFEWQGGSWDYPNYRGLSLGTSAGHVMCRLGRIEYNPCATGALIDGSNATASCVLSGALFVFAAPSTATPTSETMFKASYDNQFKFSDSRILDHSASAALTQNYKIGNGYKVITDNVKSITLFDYFISKSCVNAQGVGLWSIVNASTYLNYSINKDTQQLVISSSATVPQEQIINVFIPMRELRRFTDVSALITATVPNVACNVAFSIGYRDPLGPSNVLGSSYYIDNNEGGAYTLNNGKTFPYGVYNSIRIAKHFKHDQGANYTEQGLILKFNLFNLLASSGNIYIDANATGAITL